MSAELLERLGNPADTVVSLDFETYYSAEYSLSKLTNEAYVRDERFEVIGVGVRVSGVTSWLEEWEFRSWAKRVDWGRVAVVANHAQFDGFVLSERYNVRPAFWFDTMYMGRLLHGEGALERLGLRYGLGGKTEGALAKAKGKRRADFTEREWREYGEYCKRDVDLCAQLRTLMQPQVPKLELWVIDSVVRWFTEPVFVANTTVLREAWSAERARKAAFLDGLMTQCGGTQEDMRAMLSSADKFAAELRRRGVEPGQKRNNKGELIYAFAQSDTFMKSLLEHEVEDVRFLAEARLAVKSTIVETRTERLLGIAQRGRVPFYLKYSGAHTHRLSGGDRMNPQNFNRGGALRGAIEVDEESEIVVADSGQIEARMVAWLAGQSGLLETFRRNDVKTQQYQEAFAARVEALGNVVTKEQAKAIDRELAALGIVEGDFYSDVGSEFFLKQISKVETPTERQLAKNMILGLGFSMGWPKFSLELLKGMLGAKPVQFTPVEAARFGVDVAAFEARQRGDAICGDVVRAMYTSTRLTYAELLVHCAVADFFVRRYRDTYPKIPALWRTCESMLRVMEVDDGDPGVVRMRYRGLEVLRHAIRKPSGLVLRYPGLRRTADGYRYLGGKSGREMVKIYGGLLTENLVQSLARDVVFEQAMRVRADGIRLATSTHDELVAVVPRGQGEAALRVVIGHMRTPPAWCADLPLNAEGGFGTCYGDIK